MFWRKLSSFAYESGSLNRHSYIYIVKYVGRQHWTLSAWLYSDTPALTTRCTGSRDELFVLASHFYWL